MHIVLTGVKGVRGRCETKERTEKQEKGLISSYSLLCLSAIFRPLSPCLICSCSLLITWPLLHTFSSLHSLHLRCREGGSYCSFLPASHLWFQRWQWYLWRAAFLLTALALGGDSIISDVLMSHSISISVPIKVRKPAYCFSDTRFSVAFVISKSHILISSPTPVLLYFT